jgi:hypothetical protein
MAGFLPLGLWLVSGLAMPFVSYPSVDDGRRREALPSLLPVGPAIAPTDCMAGLVVERLPETGLVGRCADDPAHGLGFSPLHAREATAIATNYAKGAGVLIETEILENADLWTLPNALQARLPALRSHFESGLAVDVSLRTGEVIQATDRRSRWLAWLGPVPHWLYVTPLRRHRDPWRWVVMLASALAALTVVTGLWNGLRVSLRRGLESPYRGVRKQHHVLGIAAGTFLSLWCLSGFLSVNPGHWSSGSGSTAAQRAAWASQPSSLRASDWTLCEHVHRPVRLIVWQVGHHHAVRCEGAEGHALGEPPSLIEFDAAARRVVRGEKIDTAWISIDPDDAYLESSRAVVLETRALRLAADPSTGELLQVLSRTGRAERWLYQGLHTWNVRFLVAHPEIRRTLQVVGVGLGLLLLITGARLILRRLSS